MNKLSKENSFRFSLLACIFFIPISQNVSIKLLILAIVLSLFLIRNENWKKGFLRNGGDCLLYFVILSLGLLYTENMSNGLSVLEKNLSFIGVPLLFSRINFLDKKFLNHIFVTFTAGVLVASLICLGYAFWRDLSLHYANGYYYDQFTAIIDSHPTYMAYYICFTIIFLLYLISYEENRKLTKYLIISSIFFLAFTLMLTAGRTTFISMMMMASFFFLKVLFEPYPLKRKLQGITVSVAMLIIILLQSPYSKKIFPNFPNGRSASIEQIKGDSWERLALWESAIHASSNLFIGVGTGDYTREINAYYRSHDLHEYAEINFNAHNQFIQTLFSNGLIGLAVLLVLLLRPIVFANRRQNIFGMLTFFPFLIYGISEVFLGRYQGIIFFTLLHQIFITYFNQSPDKFSVRNHL